MDIDASMSDKKDQDLDAPYEPPDDQDLSPVYAGSYISKEDDEDSELDVEIVLDSVDETPPNIPTTQAYGNNTEVPLPEAQQDPTQNIFSKRKKSKVIKIIENPLNSMQSSPYEKQDGTVNVPEQSEDIAAMIEEEEEAAKNENEIEVYNLDLENMEEAPWREPGVDLGDYFNYGFNEETWMEYARKVRLLGTMNTHLEIRRLLEQQNVPLDTFARKSFPDNTNEYNMSWCYDNQFPADAPDQGYAMNQPDNYEPQKDMYNIPPPINQAPINTGTSPNIHKSRRQNSSGHRKRN